VVRRFHLRDKRLTGPAALAERKHLMELPNTSGENPPRDDQGSVTSVADVDLGRQGLHVLISADADQGEANARFWPASRATRAQLATSRPRLMQRTTSEPLDRRSTRGLEPKRAEKLEIPVSW
jgi:hypothetical protein